MQYLLTLSRRICALTACVVLALVPLLAQPGEGTVTGTVLDQVGKAVPNATVEFKSEAGGSSRSVTTDPEGRFSATGLPAGAYSIWVSAHAFSTSTNSAH